MNIIQNKEQKVGKIINFKIKITKLIPVIIYREKKNRYHIN